jgi:hypothetical protein
MDAAQMPSMISSTQLLVMLFSVVVGIVTMIGFVLWAAKHAYEERRRLRCPVQRRMVKVLFGLAPNGTRTDVLRCAVFKGGAPFDCGKACLRATGT